MNQADFLDLIYSDAAVPERRICIFVLPGERFQFFDAAEEAAGFIASLPATSDVYHGMSLVGGTPKGRGESSDMVAYGSLWCDVDVAGGPHKGPLPPDKGAAIELLDSLLIPPSLIVDSGYGIHGYWPLAEVILFEDPESRKAAANVAKRWHGIVCDAAKTSGWKLANLGDLPRVLRTPGTANNKVPGAAPLPVMIVRNTGEVFDYQRFVAATRERPSPGRPVPAASLPIAGAYSPLDRCRMYLDQVPPAIQGANGGAQTLVACKAIFRFGLSGGDIRAAFEHYNARCVPPWTDEKQIAHKLVDAEKSVDQAGERGKLLTDGWVTGDPVGDVAADSILKSANGVAPVPEPASPPDHHAPFPADCLEVPGLLNQIIEYNLRTALYPQPELALAGAISLLAVITGRKVADARGTRTNVYVLGLAPSGGGKEHARKINKEILIRAGAEKMIGPERIASSAGMVSSVASQPAILFQLDEIGRLLSTMKNPAKQPHLYNIGTVLLQLYSSSDSLWIADAYADAKKTKRINQPHACVYGTSVPSAFWDNLTSENVSEGLLGRLLTFEATSGYVPISSPVVESVPEEITTAVRWWLEFTPGGIGNLNIENPAPAVIGYSSEARKRIDDHLAGICARRSKESETTAAVWSRSGEKTAKLALLFACSRATPSMLPRVEIEDVDRAIKIANWLTRKMLRKAFEHVAENETESRSKKLLRLITGELTMNELTRKTQWLRGKERYEIISDLQAAGYVVMEQKDTGGRPLTIIRRMA